MRSSVTTRASVPPRRRTGPAVAGAVLMAVGLGACGGADDSETQGAIVDTGGEASVSGRSVDSSTVSHVHALDVDPTDPGVVYVATHDGLLRFEAGSGLTRVGDLRSDLMGFAVGPGGDLLASGHPSATEDAPAALGLIRSSDGGETWRSVALSGEADLHTMDAASGAVVGYDAATGVLRVSRDGRDFADRDAGSGYIDISVDPTSAETIYGTTAEARLVASDDGGRTFDDVAGAPPLVLVDVAEDGSLAGIGTDGSVHTSTDGAVWQAREGAADPGLQAFTAGADGTLWIMDSRGLVRSDDGGDSFAEVDGW